VLADVWKLGVRLITGGKLLLIELDRDDGKAAPPNDGALPAGPGFGCGIPLRLGRREPRRRAPRRRLRASLRAPVSTYRVSSGEEYWQVFSSSYGPTKTLAESLDPDRREQLHQDWVDFFENEYLSDGEVAHTEYLLVLGARR
jgi:hypothetical protein